MDEQDRSQRCVLHHPYRHGVQKVSKVSVAESSLRVYLPSLWSGDGTKDIHQAVAPSGGISEITRGALCHLFGRPSDHAAGQGGLGRAYSNSCTFVGSFGFLGQLSQISPRAIADTQFSGICGRFFKEGIEVTTREARPLARSILKGEYASARKLVQLLGKMSAAVLAVQPAPLHYRELQHLKHTALKAGGYDTMVKVSPRAKEDLTWWVNNLDQWNGKKLDLATPEIAIETDASRSGWGAFSQGKSTGGCWDQQESHFHINALEMLAVFYALKAFLKYQQGVSVLMLSDNQSVVAHINKLGGTRSEMLCA